MTTTSGIPITLELDATDYVDGLGLRPVLEKILEAAALTFPGVRCLQVKLDPYSEEEPKRVLIEVLMASEFRLGDAAMHRFMDWVVAHLAPREWQYFGVWRESEPTYGR